MAKEIEAKFFIYNKESIRKNLSNIGLKLIEEEHLMKRKCFHCENHKDGTWIRVRDEGKKITMTYKSISGKGINDIEEVEIEVSSFESACELITKTNYFEVSYQETMREIWRNKEVEVVIDTWPFLQNYIEIEAKTEEIVKKYAKLLGFDFENEAYFGGVAVLYEKQYSIPMEIINNIPLFVFDDEELNKKLQNYKNKA
ncbi:MAG: CYTH domain-containing protein [Rickettsiales bacterium]|nr:CYTH domain-containing protein [Rickettsiales bacterium]